MTIQSQMVPELLKVLDEIRGVEEKNEGGTEKQAD